MTDAEYFFLIFLGTIAVTRFLLLSKIGSPTIKGFRLRHYMYGVVLIVLALLVDNLTIYAIGWGLLVDELPLVLFKGSGRREEYWKGIEDYYKPWCVVGVLILVFAVYIFRVTLVGLI